MGTEKRERQKANRQLKYQQEAKQQSRRKLTKRVVIGGVAAVALLLFVLLLAWFANRGNKTSDSVVSPTIGSTRGDGVYVAAFDYNNDGFIDISDIVPFRNRIGASI